MSSLLFVHIAKAGGTSLRRLLKLHEEISRFDCFHNGFLLRFENARCVGRHRAELNSLEQYDIAVIALRHPVDRLQSCYHYFLSGGLNGRGKGEFLGDLRCQKYLKSVAPTFSTCTQRLDSISTRIPHFLPASYWLDSLAKPIAKSIFCCRQESFAADVNGLFKALNLPLSRPLEHRNKSANSTGAILNISGHDLQCIKHFYSADFTRFGYETDFTQSLPLVQYWDQPEPPDLIARRMEVCKSLNPGWDYHLFNRKTAAGYLKIVYGSDIASAFLDIRLPAMQADVFRVAFLLHSGGLWVDAATSLIRPVETWLDRRHSLQMLRRSHQEHPKISSGVIYASRPGLPLLKAAWEEMVPRLLSRSGAKVYRDFGPGLFRNLMGSSPNIAFGLYAVPEALLEGFLKLGSSGNILSSDYHWSKRQQSESLYFSGE
ncbi:capsular polysaccharide synthesis protein [Synechococcus sp. MU1617]|uniref:capsular polysaccharide synthesis protein n=1 Tax=Synechococcus sp. MU1617 TaxID=2508346 RepID=UPI001CF82E22|nr:capsular polysaccharide synthesis protein [Synechococcus sp. MU1617]MCB4389392.1 hypothetical protein [Synechococcus sp. MU1617]